jgi:phage shock protein A
MQTGVEECWLIAKRGQTLVEARRGIDLADVDRQLADVAAQAAAYGGEDASTPDPSLAPVAQSLEAQRATAERLDRVIKQAHGELRMLDARLDEAVARTLELSAHASADATVEGLGTDVDALVTEMESLRQALEETSRTPHHGLAAGGSTE